MKVGHRRTQSATTGTSAPYHITASQCALRCESISNSVLELVLRSSMRVSKKVQNVELLNPNSKSQLSSFAFGGQKGVSSKSHHSRVSPAGTLPSIPQIRQRTAKLPPHKNNSTNRKTNPTNNLSRGKKGQVERDYLSDPFEIKLLPNSKVRGSKKG